MTSAKIITRFAPSPTGFLHIGGARTALFNWLFAKRMGGEFRLRVEDTDKARSTPEATQAILSGLAWLGITHDGDTVYQSQRAERHIEGAHALLSSGAAYRCYCSPEELESLREDSRNSDTAFRSPWRESDDPSDKPFTIRFRVPDGKTQIDDKVQGTIKWDNKAFDDLVLLRADGTPTYMLAVVVDDHDMGVTHVIRGDDHLINAGRQTLIYKALGWSVPQWAHVPLIHGPDGKKLSKRHGAQGIEDYRDMGYIPEGLRNYLVKLGWSHGDQELFFDDEAAQVFDLKGINESPARLDFDKMDFINGQHLQRADKSDIMEISQPFFETVNGEPLDVMKRQRVSAALDILKPRAKTLIELANQAEFLLINRPLQITGKAKKSLKNDALVHLQGLNLRLSALNYEKWSAENLQTAIQSYASDNDIGFGKIGQPVRAALTGGLPSPDLSQVLFLLGKDEALGRIADVLKTDN